MGGSLDGWCWGGASTPLLVSPLEGGRDELGKGVVLGCGGRACGVVGGCGCLFGGRCRGGAANPPLSLPPRRGER